MKITIETVVHAPLNRVWDAWNNPHDIKQWNAAQDDWHTTRSSVDLRVGGKFIGTGNTTLHYAVRLGNPQMVARILARAKDAKLDVDAHGSGGWSPLGLAVRVGNAPVVDALLAAGARGDAIMGTGKSPLDIARVNNRLAMIETIEKSLKSA